MLLALPVLVVAGAVAPVAVIAHFLALARRGRGRGAEAVVVWSLGIGLVLTVAAYAVALAWVFGFSRMPRSVATFLENQGLLVLVPILLVNLLVANVFTSERALARHEKRPGLELGES
jgi:hypothetical protein